MFPDDDIEDPQEPSITPEQFLADQKRSIRRKAWWGIGIGGFVVLGHLALFSFLFWIQDEIRDELGEPLSWKLLFRSIFFIFGLMGVVGGLYGLYYAHKLTLADLIPSDEALRFLREGFTRKPIFSLTLVALLVAVTIVQLGTEHVESYFLLGTESSKIAGLVKPLVWEGEWWRILTAATIHGFFPLHLYFNGQALYGFGALIEQLSNRAHLPIVFLLSIVGGGFFSLFFMPNITSIGASGGIMGLIGYMAVFGYRRQRQLPPNFLRSMLVNIGSIAAFGIIGYQFIDNFAHLGGLVTGALYGLVQIPGDPNADPRRANNVIRAFGMIALAIFGLVCLFTASLLIGRPNPF